MKPYGLYDCGIGTSRDDSMDKGDITATGAPSRHSKRVTPSNARVKKAVRRMIKRAARRAAGGAAAEEF